mmetsp:Transcript_280/g.377  ORF Transcript_280/g.377 Transcript_280/m.377 type:complete len:330 (-) Transcript_280:86-1075(-)
MQGRGVTTYSTTKPSHEYTTSTTEFDDALLQRGIITFEQAMLGKGCSPLEAERLCQEKRLEQEQKRKGIVGPNKIHARTDYEKDDNSDSDDDDDDDEFLKRHRMKRLNEIQNEKYGNVIPIQRNEWNHQVNDASQDGTWVIIHLTSQKSSPNRIVFHKDICLHLENTILPELAMKYPTVKFVSIPSTSAIENWPDHNLPTLFCYKYAKLQCQLVGLEQFGISIIGVGGNMHCVERITLQMVESRLCKFGVIDGQDIEVDDDNYNDGCDNTHGYSKHNNRKQWNNIGEEKNRKTDNKPHFGRSNFGGKMAQLQTGNGNNKSDMSDYDDVD